MNDKKEQPQRRLREVGIQAKATQNQELADLKEILIYTIMHLRDRLTDADYLASIAQDRGRCVGWDSYDQKMLWEEIVEKRNQLALEELEFDGRKSAELGKVAEKMGTKRRVHSAEQERENILRSQEVASEELQNHINAIYQHSSSRVQEPGIASHHKATYEDKEGLETHKVITRHVVTPKVGLEDHGIKPSAPWVQPQVWHSPSMT